MPTSGSATCQLGQHTSSPNAPCAIWEWKQQQAPARRVTVGLRAVTQEEHYTQTNAAVITVLEVRRGNPIPPTFPLGLVAG